MMQEVKRQALLDELYESVDRLVDVAIDGTHILTDRGVKTGKRGPVSEEVERRIDWTVANLRRHIRSLER